MAFKIKGGAPTSSSDISLWNSSLTSVISDAMYGKVYNIYPNGFMSQFIYSEMQARSVSLTIEYKLVGKNETFCTIKMLGESNAYSKIVLTPTMTYRKLVIELPMPESVIDSISIEIDNITSSNLQIAYIDIAGVAEVTPSTSIDANKFASISILYGSDANKPKLR